MADWVTISSLATAGGTLVLAGATFAAVRSANRSARLAEQSLLAGIRPLLISSRMDDPPQKVYFVDGKYVVAPGGQAGVDASDEAIYLAIALRNAGSGIAVLHGWTMLTGEIRQPDHLPLEDFTRLTRDLYLGAGRPRLLAGLVPRPLLGGVRRGAPRHSRARAVRRSRSCTGTRKAASGGSAASASWRAARAEWLAEAGRHWNLDRADPR